MSTARDITVQLTEKLDAAGLDHLAVELKAAYPDRRVVVLPPGVIVSDGEQLDRIESKLAALMDALAADGEEEQDTPVTTLDGEALAGERDQAQSLG